MATSFQENKKNNVPVFKRKKGFTNKTRSRNNKNMFSNRNSSID